MKELGINPRCIGIIVISHAHGDHTGGLWDVLAMNRGVEVYVPALSGTRILAKKVIEVIESIQISEGVFSTGELKGTVVVVSCSHPGVSEIFQAASQFGKVYGIVGGLHGFHDFDRLRGLSLICPCHCTQYKSEIRRLFPEQHVACGAGLELEL